MGDELLDMLESEIARTRRVTQAFDSFSTVLKAVNDLVLRYDFSQEIIDAYKELLRKSAHELNNISHRGW